MADDDILEIYKHRIYELEVERDNVVKMWMSRGRELDFVRDRYQQLHNEFEAFKANASLDPAKWR